MRHLAGYAALPVLVLVSAGCGGDSTTVRRRGRCADSTLTQEVNVDIEVEISTRDAESST